MKAINQHSFGISMGFVFERWWRDNSHLFAEKLGFAAVSYTSGAFFNRADSKIIVAEAKYYDGRISASVAKDVNEKVRLFVEHNPTYKNYTFETLLITTEGLSKKDETRGLFDHVITLEDIFAK